MYHDRVFLATFPPSTVPAAQALGFAKVGWIVSGRELMSYPLPAVSMPCVPVCHWLNNCGQANQRKQPFSPRMALSVRLDLGFDGI